MNITPRTLLLGFCLCLLLPVSTLAYYSPKEGRWISRDPIGENDGPNVFCFVSNDTTMRSDKWGLFQIPKLPQCGCKCGFVVITGFPVAPPSFGWYRFGRMDNENAQFNNFGNLLRITWFVEGNPRHCKYGQPETGTMHAEPVPPAFGSVRNNVPKGLENVGTVHPIFYGENTATYYDPMGILFLPGNSGKWKVTINLALTFTCTSSSGEKTSIGPLPYTYDGELDLPDKFSSPWPPFP